ncbi:MAG: ABC transporter ATP-binding protein [Nocardioidaceae bacterium]
MTSTERLVLRDVEFAFVPGIPVLGPIKLSFTAGEQCALVGPSGSGKSTLLHLLGGVLSPTAGSVELDGEAFSSLPADARAKLRLQGFGMVFQFAELMPELSVRENAELPLRLLGLDRGGRDRGDAVTEALEALGIGHLSGRMPTRLSGGERQRAALARAIVHRPRVILADEPTGALDSANREQVMDLLCESASLLGATLVVVTHDSAVAARFARVATLRDGHIAE